MPLLCLGLSHHTTPVAVRERLACTPAVLQAALARCGPGRALTSRFEELAILSTCNRLEVYAVTQTADFAGLSAFLAETTGAPRALFEPHLYRHQDEAASRHLFRVAAGLDSLVLGEPQILGQVADAYEMARGQGAAGPLLSGLFQAALRAGKRVRAETAIGRDPATISSVAVKLAEQTIGDLRAAHIAVLGAGEMAELAVGALRQRGAGQLTVVNRTLARAAELAARWGARPRPMEQLAEALTEADVLIASTAAPQVLVTPSLLAALPPRAERPLVVIDIAVPRNVDPAVARLPGLHYFDIDALHGRLNGALAKRAQAARRAETIVAEEAAAFEVWRRGQAITPLLAELRAKAEHIRRAEVAKTLRRWPDLDEAERCRIEHLSEALVNKLLHAPTLRLRAEAAHGQAAEYAAVVRQLFALQE